MQHMFSTVYTRITQFFTSGSSVAELVSRYAIASLFFLLPFFFVPTPWISILHAKVFLIAFAAIVVTVALGVVFLTEARVQFPKSLLLLAASLIPLAYLSSAIASNAPHSSFIGSGVQQDTVVAVFLWYVLFVAALFSLHKARERTESAFKALLFGGVILVLIQLARIAFPSFTFGGVLVSSTANAVGSWHDLGIFLGLLLFALIAAVQAKVVSGFARKVFIVAAIFAGALLLVLNFEDTWIAVGVLSFVYALYLFFSKRYALPSMSVISAESSAFRKSYVWWGVLGVVALALAFFGTSIVSKLPAQFQIAQIEVRPSWQGTYAVGTKVLAEPSVFVFGSGPNTFTRVWGQYKPLDVNTTEFWNVDFYSGVGFIPTSLVTVGFLGAIAWGVVILALLWSAFALVRSRGNNAAEAGILPIVIFGAIYLTIFHVLYVPSMTLSALTFLFFGLLVASEVHAGRLRTAEIPLTFDSVKSYAGIVGVLVFGGLVLFGGVQTLRSITSDSLVNRGAYIFNTTGNIEQATRSIQTALVAYPSNDSAHRAAVELGLLQMRALLNAEQSQEAIAALQSTLTTTIEHGLSAVSIESANYQNWLSLARLYAELAGVGVSGADANARNAYEEARTANPTNPTPLVGLALLSVQAGDDTNAKTYLEQALQLKPNLPIAYFLLSQIEARGGDLQSAFGNAQAVATLAPQDPLAWYHLGTILYAGQDFTNAALAFERAIGIENNYANALYLLSASYAAQGRLDDALLALKAVLQLNPQEETIQTMLATFEEGGNPFNNSPAEEE